MNERDLFTAALQKEDPAQRSAFLDQACAGDADLRKRVEGLLQAHLQASSAFQKQGTQPEGTGAYQPDLPQTPVREGPGTRIGPYKLLQKIGEGGMGVVYLAEQEQPVRRRVAFKIIKPGMDSRQVIARFEAERQALALMDHQNIARVLDAGTTGTGRPYFVMELVHGVPITQFCDQRKLTTRQRLELFVPVCQAIQHAHTKGIIHRDVKPSNVLVTMYDDKPVPKVIDFGLAKALEQRLTDKTLFTQFGTLVGTYEYMSPEQAQMDPFGVDTRSDVYSLGVLLYELLTGTTPLERKRLRQAALEELLRLIKEEEPPRPSVRLSSSDSLPAIAAARQAEPARLSRLVRGELDWIVMKALEKDRARRYETANGLARDVERYLHDEPVEACPPGAGYRLGKLIRKHRRLFGTAAAFAVLVLAGAALSLGLAVRATRAERVARVRLGQVEEEERRADGQRSIAEAVNAFLQEDLLGKADIAQQQVGEGGRDPDVKVRELLDRAARAIEGKFAEQPLTEAAIRLTIGNTYKSLGLYGQAQAHLERSVRLRSARLGADHLDTLTSKEDLAGLYVSQGKYDQAEPLAREVLHTRTAKLGSNHPDTLISKNNLAVFYHYRGKYEEAETLYREVLKARAANLGPDDPETLKSRYALAVLYHYRGKYEEAETLYREVLKAKAAKLGADHPDTLTTKSSLARLSHAQGKYEQAQSLYQEVLKARTAKLGADHPDTLLSKGSLASLHRVRGKYEEAEPLYLEVLKAKTATLGADHPHTLTSKSSLASLYQAQGKYGQAEPLNLEVLRTRTAKLGADHPDTLTSRNNLAMLYYYQGKYDRAEKLYQEVLRQGTASLGADHPNTLLYKNNLALLYQAQGKHEQAEPLHKEVLQTRRAKLGADHPHTLTSMHDLALLYQAQGKHEQADSLLRELVTVWKRKAGAQSPQYAWPLASLGHNLLQQQKFAEAEPLLRASLAIREKHRPDDWRCFNTLSLLGGSLLGQKKHAEAEPLLLQGYEGVKQREARIPAPNKVYLTDAVERLVQLYEAWAKKDEAARWRAELASYPRGRASCRGEERAGCARR